MASYISIMDKLEKTAPTHNIGVLLFDGFALMSYAALTEPMRAANLLAGRQLYSLRIVPADGLRSISSGGAHVEGNARLSQDLTFDTVFVVAGGDLRRIENPTAINWLRRLARRGVTLGGVSGGPVVLANAGVMADRRLTVHWEHADLLLAAKPNLMLERSLYVFDRDRITCAGGVAPMDMMHEMIARHHGAAFAREVSDWFLQTEIRPATGPQRAGLVEKYGITNPAVITALEVMENTIAEPLSLGQLAAATQLSPRQLNRLCLNHLGQSTMHAYRAIRLDKAQQLLRQTPLSITQIALATGFTNPGHFATAFRDKFGTSPTKIRA